MNKGINWEETTKNWKPSDGDCVALDKADPIISGVCKVMEHCFCSEKDSMVQLAGERTFRELRIDKVDKWSLLEIGFTQLAEHKKAWKTHLKKDEKTGNLTIEFPVVTPKVPHLRYFKVIIKDGVKVVGNPKSVSEIFLRYHQAKEVCEVIYVESN